LPDVSIDLLIARADAALYCAKANGRNRIECDRRMLTIADRGFGPDVEMTLGLSDCRPSSRMNSSLCGCDDGGPLPHKTKKGRHRRLLSLHRYLQCWEDTHNDAYAE
jgi:hypothetical protein